MTVGFHQQPAISLQMLQQRTFARPALRCPASLGQQPSLQVQRLASPRLTANEIAAVRMPIRRDCVRGWLGVLSLVHYTIAHTRITRSALWLSSLYTRLTEAAGKNEANGMPKLISSFLHKREIGAESSPSSPENVPCGSVLPNYFAVPINLESATAAAAGDEKMTVGQSRRRRGHRCIHLNNRFPVAVVLGHLIAIGLCNEDMTVGQQINAAGPGTIAVGGKLFEVLAAGVHDNALAAAPRQADNPAVASSVGGSDASADIIDGIYLLALPVHFQNLVERGDERVPVGQPLHVDGLSGQSLGPDNVALEGSLADFSTHPLGNEDTVAADNPGIDGERHAVDGPALLAVAVDLKNAIATAIA